MTVYSRVVDMAGKELWRSKSERIDEGVDYPFETTPHIFWVNGRTWEAIVEWRDTVNIIGYHKLRPTQEVKANE